MEFFHGLVKAYSGVDGVVLWLSLGLFILGLATCEAKHTLFVISWVAMPFLFVFLVRAKHFFDPRHAILVLPVSLLVVARGVASLAALAERYEYLSKELLRITKRMRQLT